MLFEGGFSFTNFLTDVVTIFAFVIWFWLVITIFGDLFRRHDISGWGKALWVIVVILTSYIGVLIYLITQGRGMAERNAQHAQQATACDGQLASVSLTKLRNSTVLRNPERLLTRNSLAFGPSWLRPKENWNPHPGLHQMIQLMSARP